MKKIILLGYMGSGKSTIAQLLSEKLSVKCLDLDAVVEENEQMSISEIFEKKGEIYFRKKEHFVFKELLQTKDNLIISLGGGTPCYAGNHELLNGDNIQSFYLKSSLEVLLSRLKNKSHKRPIIQGKTEEELREFIAPHLFERSYFYQQATHIIDTDGLSKEQVVQKIISVLR